MPLGRFYSRLVSGVKPERALMTEVTNVLGVALSGRSCPWDDENISSSISGVNNGEVLGLGKFLISVSVSSQYQNTRFWLANIYLG